MMDSQAACIYEKVYITGVTFAQRGLAVRVQFSTARAGKNIVWEYSKRLISGSIVALSPANDLFQSKCVVAVVAARPLDGVKQQPPQVDLFFARAEDADFDPQREWVMVEARTGYYEASRHTMTALQRMTMESFPLSDHICDLNPYLELPEYVKDNPVVDISSALRCDSDHSKFDLLAPCPPVPTDDLDSSQWDALNQILRKRLSIVQGPPGTGKTHISIVALKIILSSMKEGDPPVIVAAQTNHALDQLLSHISLFEPNYVRLGGRSANMEIKKRTPYELRPSFFLELNLLTQPQYDSLKKGAEGWVRSGYNEDDDPMATWLGDSVTKFEVVYKKENFGFEEEEIDLEYEQLKELEAEQGLEDEDLETLKGRYTYLKEGFIGCGAPSVSEKAVMETHLKRRDLWKVPANARGAVYNTLRKLAKAKILPRFRQLLGAYDKNCAKLQTGKWERDCVILEQARVIGMTTTGLSKYRALVSSLKPKIIIIEEAAEVIEAPVTVACVNSLEHLILVGDHKQLQGHCSVKELEGEPFFLNISLFERLVHNGIDFKALTRQRRMHPEIRRLLSPIYDNLQDHPSVLNRPKIPGMGDVRSFFFCHTWPESSDSLSSRYNQEEAQMIVGFFLYLVFNGVPVRHITILTFYNGQRKKLLKLLKDHRYLQGQYVKVVTVDSYQGEENEIVLLSLVRSSERGNIGFVSVENRVCVALSRAKSGFYIFGNGASVAIADPLWWEIVKMMGDDGQKQRRLGFSMPLTCVKHGNKTFIRTPEQWNAINGGCEQMCGEKLPCGHICDLRCHGFPHASVRCNQICGRSLPCGHRCNQPCSIDQPCYCDCGGDTNASAIEELTIRDEATSHQSIYPYPVQTPPKVKSVIRNDRDHGALLQRYREFANGGAKEQDELLAARANDLAAEEMKNQLDDEAFKDLFGNYGHDTKMPEPNVPGTHTVTRVPDGKGGFRERYVDYYFNGQASPTKPPKQWPPEYTLLDDNE
ncbi:hypothetical protein VTN02DRAFT_6731 [Thermoascus thermophilus]